MRVLFCLLIGVVLPCMIVSIGRADDLHEFLKSNCIDCHSDDAPEAGLSLESLPMDMDDDHRRHFWVKVHDRIKLGEMPPEEYGEPDANESAAFLNELADRIIRHERSQHQKHGRTVLRRLNRVEYENTLRDRLFSTACNQDAERLNVKDMLPPDQSLGGFDNQSDALELSFVHITRYLDAAEFTINQIRLGEPTALAAGTTTKTHPRSEPAASAVGSGKRATTAPSQKSYQQRSDDMLQIKKGISIGRFRAKLRQTNTAQTPYRLQKLKPHVDGVYRFQLDAFGCYWNHGKAETARDEQVLSIYASPRKSVTRLVHRQTLSGDPKKPSTIDIEVFLHAGEELHMHFSTLTTANIPAKIARETLEGDAIAVDNARLQGPLPQPNDCDPKPAWLAINSDFDDGHIEPLLVAFMRQVCRHSIDPPDSERYARIVREELKRGVSPVNAIKSGYQAILCSPSFLFFNERPGQLDGDALAARLSYFLWKSPPDQLLLAAARRHELNEHGSATKHVDRMIADRKFDRMIVDIAGQWFDLNRINFTQPDERLYPESDAYLKESMIAETRATLKRMFRENLPVSELVDSDHVLINRRLAKHYGLEEISGTHLRPVKLPSNSPRGGLLTQAAVLTVTANGTNTSPVTRGAWVLDRILGTPPPEPPPNIPAIEPDIKGATTMREQLSQHRDNDACRSCHAKIDPPGFALESFDVMGGFRERYRSLGKGKPVTEKIHGHKPQFRIGMDIDASGQMSDGQTFTDIAEFKQILLRNERQIARNVVNRLIAYATGSPVRFADRPEVEMILDRNQSTGYRMKNLVISVVTSKAFQHK